MGGASEVLPLPTQKGGGGSKKAVGYYQRGCLKFRGGGGGVCGTTSIGHAIFPFDVVAPLTVDPSPLLMIGP